MIFSVRYRRYAGFPGPSAIHLVYQLAPCTTETRCNALREGNYEFHASELCVNYVEAFECCKAVRAYSHIFMYLLLTGIVNIVHLSKNHVVVF